MNDYQKLLNYVTPVFFTIKQEKTINQDTDHRSAVFINLLFGYIDREDFKQKAGFDMDTAFMLFTKGKYIIPEHYDEDFSYLKIQFSQIEETVGQIYLYVHTGIK